MTPARLEELRRIFSDLKRLAEAHDSASTYFDRCYRAALRTEREHRARGRRFTHGWATYRHSCADAARYFTCKWIIGGWDHKPRSWADAASMREDTLYGLAVRDILLKAHRRLPKTFDFEYVRDIVGGRS